MPRVGTFPRGTPFLLAATCGGAVKKTRRRPIRPCRFLLPHQILRDGMLVSRPRFDPRKASRRGSLGELRPQAPFGFSFGSCS